jgi:hypothetical protein
LAEEAGARARTLVRVAVTGRSRRDRLGTYSLIVPG